MKIRSRAPLRIGLAGGGTDLAAYSDQYGGVVLNATIGMYAYCTIIPTNDNKIKIYAYDNKNTLETDSVPYLPIDDDNTLILHKGIYNRIVKDFNGGKPLSFIMSTSNDAPIGSGLGTSSTMVVAILEAYNKWLSLGLNDYQKAQLAYEIERIDLGLAGGKQDQYAAVFGGFNLIEFRKDTSVIVNPFRIDKGTKDELECAILLYYSGTDRKSADQQKELASNIIKDQSKNATKKESGTIDAMKKLKEYAYIMKDCVLIGDFKGFSNSLKIGWENKKKTSSIISNPQLEETINYALENGAESVKVSGAGGGGFIMFYCDPINRQKLIYALNKLPGTVYPVTFTDHGVESWIVD